MKKYVFLLLLIATTSFAQQNSVSIQQLGSDNTIAVNQLGSLFSTIDVSSFSNNGNIVINQHGILNSTTVQTVGTNTTVNIEQSGIVKNFNLSITAFGGSATVVQTNPFFPDNGGMQIYCVILCAGNNWQYIRR
jgi:hypothetical protein